jgi:hypothetical protein
MKRQVSYLRKQFPDGFPRCDWREKTYSSFSGDFALANHLAKLIMGFSHSDTVKSSLIEEEIQGIRNQYVVYLV